MTHLVRKCHRRWSAVFAASLLVATTGCGVDNRTSTGLPSDSGDTAVVPTAPPAATTSLLEATTTVHKPEHATTDYQNIAAAEEAYQFDSFAGLIGGADLVVLASMVTLGDGPPEGSAEYPFPTADVELAVTEVLRGTAQPDNTSVSVRLPVGQAAGDFARLQDSLPTREAIWVLRYLTPTDHDTFAVLTTGSIIEAAPDGSAQPAWYRATAAQARAGSLSSDAIATTGQNGPLAVELAAMTFHDAVATARAPEG